MKPVSLVFTGFFIVSYEGIGLYDVTRDTMPDILRGRELMSDTRMRDIPRGEPEFLRAREAYNENKATPLEAIFKQISNRAEEKYNYDPNVEIRGSSTF